MGIASAAAVRLSKIGARGSAIAVVLPSARISYAGPNSRQGDRSRSGLDLLESAEKDVNVERIAAAVVLNDHAEAILAVVDRQLAGIGHGLPREREANRLRGHSARPFMTPCLREMGAITPVPPAQ
jgi:hypothetical protein